MNSPTLLVFARAHLRSYYSRYIRIYGLDEEDVIQSVVLKMLEGSCKNVNTACHSVVRAGIRYRKREVLR